MPVADGCTVVFKYSVICLCSIFFAEDKLWSPAPDPASQQCF